MENMRISEVGADCTAILTFSASNAVGKSSVTVLLSDNAGNKTFRSFNVKVVDHLNSSGSDRLENSLRVFPNPTEGLITIEGNEEGDRVVLMGLMGRVLINRKLQNGNRTVEVSEVGAGIYFLKLSTPNGDKAARIVIE